MDSEHAKHEVKHTKWILQNTDLLHLRIIYNFFSVFSIKNEKFIKKKEKRN